jgi:hypothetical protein
LVQKNPLDCESPWVSDDGTESLSADSVAAEMSSIGAELAVLQISNNIFSVFPPNFKVFFPL